MAYASPYGLSDLQWRFVQEYLLDLNATAAYKRAGYKSTGNAAESGASRLLRHAKVAVAVQTEKARLAATQAVTPEEVVAGWAKLSRGDIRNVLTWDTQGNVTVAASASLDEATAYAITEVSQVITPHGIHLRVKLADKKGALDSLARYFDLFKEAEGMEQLGKGLAALLDFAKGMPDAQSP
jgi:phage terminase small subunit